jgi:hypothetical protein
MRNTAAILLACVFFVVPGLRRAVDDTPISKETTGFKFSKNLELPHKKLSTVAASAPCPEPIVLDPNLPEYRFPLDVIDIGRDAAGRPSPSRAPPLAPILLSL